MEDVVELGARRIQQTPSSVLLDVEARTTELLSSALLATLAACDDVLFGHAQRATHGMRQAQFFDDQRQLRCDREMATQRFRAACRQAFRNLGRKSHEASAPQRGEAELHLVADEDLELDLALFRIGKCCDDVTPRVRHQLQRRLQVLLGLGEELTTPLCGAAIARMCRAAIAPIELGMESRLIVLKQLERELSKAVETALDQANSTLLAHGVLPHLRSVAAVARPTQPAPARSSGNAAVATSMASPAELPSQVTAADLNHVVAQVAQWLAQNAPARDTVLAEPVVEAEVPACSAPAEPDELELARERRRLEIAERRNAELNRARELRVAAERSAEAVVGVVLGQAHVPECICNVMRGPLRRHLEAVHARRGETSTEWRSACKLVRDIAWALDPETARSEQAHWREMVPDIVESLRAALVSVGIAEHEIDRVVRGFGERYEQLLSAAEPAPMPELAPDPTAAASPEYPLAPEPQAAAPSFADALRRVRQLVLGQWFELLDDQGQTQRAKLVWTSAMTERCLFVNGQGKLVADRPHARVAHDLVAGAFRELDAGAAALA